jgi:Cdc6-like AAA superfamily ATPase
MCDKPKDQNLPCNLNCKHLQKELQIIQKIINFFVNVCNLFFFLSYHKKALPHAQGNGRG